MKRSVCTLVIISLVFIFKKYNIDYSPIYSLSLYSTWSAGRDGLIWQTICPCAGGHGRYPLRVDVPKTSHLLFIPRHTNLTFYIWYWFPKQLQCCNFFDIWQQYLIFKILKTLLIKKWIKIFREANAGHKESSLLL